MNKKIIALFIAAILTMTFSLGAFALNGATQSDVLPNIYVQQFLEKLNEGRSEKIAALVQENSKNIAPQNISPKVEPCGPDGHQYNVVTDIQHMKQPEICSVFRTFTYICIFCGYQYNTPTTLTYHARGCAECLAMG